MEIRVEEVEDGGSIWSIIQRGAMLYIRIPHRGRGMCYL